MRGFDFSQHMEGLCRDVTSRLSEFAHVDMHQVGVGFRQTRQPALYGIFATLTPLRFKDGGVTTVRYGRRWTIQRVRSPSGGELLYLLDFFLPRFLDLPFREKLITVCHELWHIGPAFNGDVRRHEGRCYAHGSSKRDYDDQMELLVDRWLESGALDSNFDFLRLNARTLTAVHGAIHGRRWPRPKLLPLATA